MAIVFAEVDCKGHVREEMHLTVFLDVLDEFAPVTVRKIHCAVFFVVRQNGKQNRDALSILRDFDIGDGQECGTSGFSVQKFCGELAEALFHAFVFDDVHRLLFFDDHVGDEDVAFCDGEL